MIRLTQDSISESNLVQIATKEVPLDLALLGNNDMSHVLFYAKYSIDRKKNIKHIGTYFGDAGEVDEIKNIGIELRRSDPSLIIIPKIYKLDDSLDAISLDAQEYFETFGQKLQQHQ